MVLLDGGEPVYLGFLGAIKATMVHPSATATLSQSFAWTGSFLPQIVLDPKECRRRPNLPPSGSEAAEQTAVRALLAKLAEGMAPITVVRELKSD